MIYFFILLFLIILGINNKKSKILLIFLYLVCFFICTHITEGDDLYYNELLFNNLLVNPDAEPGEKSLLYSLLMFYFKELGFSFFQFRVICFLIWSISVFYFIIRFSKYPTYVVALCILFPMLTFSTQMRNAIMVSVVYFAISLLLTKKSKMGILLYGLLISFAGFIHNVAFFYLLAPLSLLKIKSSTLYRVCITIFFVLLVFFGSVKGYLATFSNGQYFETYFENKVDFWYIRLMFLVPCIFLNVHYLTKAVSVEQRKLNNGESIDIFSYEFSLFVMRLHYILLTLVPLLLITDHFYRIYQNMYILSAIGITNASSFYLSDCKKEALYYRYQYLLFYVYVFLSFNIVDGGFFLGFNSISF